MTWPNYFPNNCPPKHSEDISGTIYRLIKEDEPKPEDFLPHIISRPNFDYTGKECQACGLSVQRTYEDIIDLRNVIPGFRDRNISMGELNQEHGKILHTPTVKSKSHHTWWVPKEINPCDIFEAAVED